MTLLELVGNKRTQGLKDQEVTYIGNSLRRHQMKVQAQKVKALA